MCLVMGVSESDCGFKTIIYSVLVHTCYCGNDFYLADLILLLSKACVCLAERPP